MCSTGSGGVEGYCGGLLCVKVCVGGDSANVKATFESGWAGDVCVGGKCGEVWELLWVGG